MPVLLSDMIDRAAESRPEAVAARCREHSLTYGQLACQSNGLAAILLGQSVQPGDRVAVFVGKGLKVPVALYGVLKAGGVYVPVDPASPASQVASILRTCGARCLITEAQRVETVRQVLSAAPDLEVVVGIDAESELPIRCVPWDAIRAAASDQPPTVSTIDLDLAYILHTSGSTGVPKCIMHTHRSGMSFVEWAVEEYSLTAGDRLSNHSSHHTCFATFDYFAGARAGATTVIVPSDVLKMPASVASLIERERITVWYSVPTALVQLCLRGGLHLRDLSSLRWVLFAGEPFPVKHLTSLMKQLPKARFSHVYGSTEMNVCTYYHLPAKGEIPDPLPIGRACSTSRIRVVDDDLRPVARGDVGELLVRGSTVMSGYWAEPGLSSRALVRLEPVPGLEETFFRTGDLARELDDGNLEFVARADLQVKVRGHRVELAEIESAVMSLAAVEEAAVYTVPDGEGSSAIHAALVVTEGEGDVGRSLLAGLRERLPAHAVPCEVKVLQTLPRTATGKVDRRRLRAISKTATEAIPARRDVRTA